MGSTITRDINGICGSYSCARSLRSVRSVRITSLRTHIALAPSEWPIPTSLRLPKSVWAPSLIPAVRKLWTACAYFWHVTDTNLMSISRFNGRNDRRTGFCMFVLAQDAFVVQNSFAVVWAVKRPCFAQFYTQTRPARQLEELIKRWLPSFFMKARRMEQNQGERIRIALIGYKFRQPIAFGCCMKWTSCPRWANYAFGQHGTDSCTISELRDGSIGGCPESTCEL